ncbi:AMP-binding protein [Albimonas sp. CAU 1670]|uniref:AMP-binding protein n=1 Tax=Albimonas sp. CAU 1670 TaxID=3032599 RepID=UPI0023DA8919|nr:AMP-binding protein [Albimonas sp. CAU 1670]MDF2233358.1 AMP-binding protein [Albimonas sp. CAU 1670]
MTDVARRIPPREDCVFRHLLDLHAERTPDAPFAVFGGDEPDWTWADLRRKTLETANALHALGVRQGDHVLSWLENGPAPVRLWLAVNHLGAVFVPMNTAYKGGLLEHVLHLADASVMVCHAAMLPRLADVDTGPLRTIIALDGPAEAPAPGLTVLPEAALSSGSGTEAPALERPIEPWDVQTILFTSGTTGPSKAVLASYVQINTGARVSFPTTGAGDRGLVHTPLFHITGMAKIAWALATGGSIAVLDRFRTDTFWSDVRRTGATFAVMMGTIATFLAKLPRSEDEIRTPLRLALLAPSNAESEALCRRVGLDFYSVFNMSETASPIITQINPEVPGTCGRARPGMEARIVDANDEELPVGAVGELILRSDDPWVFCSGYHKNPEATAGAWRNGWFHTGDALRRDAEGNFFYVDRIKDAIRRRGENISSFEVEIEIQAHPSVAECAAVAVTSEHGEDDVLVAVVSAAGASVDPAELLAFARERMPHYMVPRFFRVMEALPKTPTLKIQKAELRRQGLTPDVWDREAAGLSVKREAVR